MLIEIHCAPNPPGNESSKYAHVDAALAVVQESGLLYEVGALGTTIEGTPDECWKIVRQMHEATTKAGAKSIITNIRIGQQANNDEPMMKDLVAPFRKSDIA